MTSGRTSAFVRPGLSLAAKVIEVGAMVAMAMLLCVPLGATPPRHPSHRGTVHKRVVRKTHNHGQAGISPRRAEQIQQALMQAGYLERCSGTWDHATVTAMKKYQSDHRWQTRFVPDARALLALGLVAPADGDVAAAALVADSGGGR